MAIHLPSLVASFLLLFAGFSTVRPAASLAETPDGELERYRAAELHMGVEFQIVLYATDEEQARVAFEAAFAEIERLNEMLSDYEPESELSRLGASSPHSEFVPISPEFAEVLRIGTKVSRESEGAFDPTVGALTRLWRRARRNGKLPSTERIEQALRMSGYEAIELACDRDEVMLKGAKLQLDLGGIAKGYAADRALRRLAELGIKSAFVNASGDITLGDPPPGKSGWGVGVAPLDASREPSRIVKLSNCGVATSGDAWQAVVIDGVRYSHILDPKTGLGLTQRSSVTVIAPNGTLADAWASAVSVMGPSAGVDTINGLQGLEALVVYLDEDEKPQVVSSRGFPAE